VKAPFRNLVTQLMEAHPAWLENLQATTFIHATVDGDLVSLKYNQIESPMHEPIVRQCRGMVVDMAARRVLAWPYDKFWNMGEPLADAIDWSTAIVQEKLDGSLMILYRAADGAWAVASSGHPTAGGTFGRGSPRTFREAFWETWNALGMQLPDGQDACFMFELCATENRVVVVHERPRIVLHGARRMDGVELSHDECAAVASQFHWEHVRTFSVASAAEAIQAAAELDAVKTEGFVVVDAQMRRVKIKSPRYVALHHLKGEATTRRAIELWRTGDAQELLTVFPELAEAILPVHRTLDEIVDLATAAVAAGQELDQKSFALRIKQEPWSGLAFALRREGGGREIADRIARAMSVPALERTVESLGVAPAALVPV
jgi:RNA ligase